MGKPLNASIKNMTPYIVSKYGLLGLLSSLKKEYEWLSVDTISPSFTRSNMLKSFDERFLKKKINFEDNQIDNPQNAADKIFKILKKSLRIQNQQMHKNLYENLEWYPEAPNDFDEKLKKIFSKKINCKELNKLIKCRLNTLNVIKIFNKFKKIEDFELKKNNLKQINLGIISNHTSSHLIPNLVVSGLRHGLVINIFEAPYDQLAQIALGDLNPFFENLNLDFILLAIDVKGYSILRQGKKFF